MGETDGDDTATDESDGGVPEYDVVVVGGGPAGCSAGVFTARDDLDTVVFDRGNSSLRRCAYLENYLGFPAGIDIETFSALAQDHAETAGCEVVDDLVVGVTIVFVTERGVVDARNRVSREYLPDVHTWALSVRVDSLTAQSSGGWGPPVGQSHRIEVRSVPVRPRSHEHPVFWVVPRCERLFSLADRFQMAG